jgi:hypothetical protein
MLSSYETSLSRWTAAKIPQIEKNRDHFQYLKLNSLDSVCESSMAISLFPSRVDLLSFRRCWRANESNLVMSIYFPLQQPRLQKNTTHTQQVDSDAAFSLFPCSCLHFLFASFSAFSPTPMPFLVCSRSLASSEIVVVALNIVTEHEIKRVETNIIIQHNHHTQ